MTEQFYTGQCSFPKAYLLTGYVNKGEPISKLTPLFNRVVIADSNEATPILLSSDEDAVLEAVDDKQLATRTLFMPIKLFHTRFALLPLRPIYTVQSRTIDVINLSKKLTSNADVN